MMRRFAADGTALGPAGPVASFLAGNHDSAGILALANGRAAVAFGVSAVTGGGIAPAVRLLFIDPATGEAAGPELLVASASGPGGNGRAMSFDGLVALSGERTGVLFGDSEGDDRLRLAVIEANGAPGATSTLLTDLPGAPWVVHTGTNDPAVALRGPNADVIAILTSDLDDPARPPDAVRFLGLDGKPALPAFDLTMPAGIATGPTLEALADVGLAVAHLRAVTASATAVRVLRLDAGGAPAGTVSGLDLVSLLDGGLVVSMTGTLAGDTAPGIFAARLTAELLRDGGIVQLDPAGTAGTRPGAHAAVAGDAIVTVWEEADGPGESGIRASRFGLGDSGVGQLGDGRADRFAFTAGAFQPGAPGQVPVQAADATGLLVLANTDNDAAAEFSVLVRGTATLVAGDFSL